MYSMCLLGLLVVGNLNPLQSSLQALCLTDAWHSSRSLKQFTAQGKNNQAGGLSCFGNNLNCSIPDAGTKASGPPAQPPQQQLQQAQSTGDTYNSGAQCTGTANNCSPPAAVVEPPPTQKSPASGSEYSPAGDSSQLQRQVCSGNASCATSTGSGNTLVQTSNANHGAPSPGQAQGPAGPIPGASMPTASQSCSDKSSCASTGPGGVVFQHNGRR